MTRLWPQTLVGRTALVLIAALLLSHLAGLAVYSGERINLLTSARGREVAAQVADAVQALEAVPAAQRREVARRLWRPRMRIAWGWQPYAATGLTGWRALLIRQAFERELGAPARGLRLGTAASGDGYGFGPGGRFGPTGRGMDGRTPEAMARGGDLAPPSGGDGGGLAAAELLVGSVRLSDGSWLNFAAPLVAFTPFWATPLFLALTLTSTVVALVAFWAVRRATRPLSMLAAAAERFGRDGDASPLDEDGPREVQAAAVAFNRMQERLKTMLAERTQMLAALSHDLRTPLTRLRLRAELIEDPEQVAKTLADLDDIKAMLDSTLSFAHDEARMEPVAAIDLAALAQTVCDEAEDAGGAVSYAGPDHLPFHGRPQILKRALANLVGNAVKYAGQARLSLQDQGAAVEITVDDDGPGIPGSELTKVFTPFYRLEGSRSRQTGGVGLGLTVVRTAAGQHGGTAALANRPGGGLRAIMRLPHRPAVPALRPGDESGQR